MVNRSKMANSDAKRTKDRSQIRVLFLYQLQLGNSVEAFGNINTGSEAALLLLTNSLILIRKISY